MKCPHCQVEIHPDFNMERFNGAGRLGVEYGSGVTWSVSHMVCPNQACNKAIIYLHKRNQDNDRVEKSWLVYPNGITRPPAPATVPPELSEDYNEACSVLVVSPKASAALSRRCLQALLRAQGYNQKDLAPAIQALLDTKKLPSALADNVDAIRKIGNFAAHPQKDTSSGEILPVEPHEAEWNLDVLEGLFDFYYVQPAKDAARRAALNEKLKAAGKPEMK